FERLGALHLLDRSFGKNAMSVVSAAAGEHRQEFPVILGRGHDAPLQVGVVDVRWRKLRPERGAPERTLQAERASNALLEQLPPPRSRDLFGKSARYLESGTAVTEDRARHVLKRSRCDRCGRIRERDFRVLAYVHESLQAALPG